MNFANPSSDPYQPTPLNGFPFFPAEGSPIPPLPPSTLNPQPSTSLPPVHPKARVFSIDKLQKRIQTLNAEGKTQSALELNVAVQRALRYPMQSLIAAGTFQVVGECQCSKCRAKRGEL